MAENCPSCAGLLYGPVGYCPHCGSALGDDARARFVDQPGSDSAEPVALSEHAESDPRGGDGPALWAEYKERKLGTPTREPAEPEVPERTRSGSSADPASRAAARTGFSATPSQGAHPARNFLNKGKEEAPPATDLQASSQRGSPARRRLRNLVLAALAAACALSLHDFVTREPAGRIFADCAGCPNMVVIPLGSFDMGSPPNEPGRYDDERRLSGVRIGRSFAMATHEVTVAQYKKFAEATEREAQPCHANLPGRLWSRLNGSTTWRNPPFHQRSDHPVVCVSHGDATAYADWLSVRTGETYRLPSEAEWEYVARAGDRGPAPWSRKEPRQACRHENLADLSLAWHIFNTSGREVPTRNFFPCDDGTSFTRSTGAGRANRFRVHDMLGNVSEWVADCDNRYHTSGLTTQSPRRSGNCARHLLRGGSWLEPPRRARHAFRVRKFESEYTTHFGFRVRRDLPCEPWCRTRTLWHRALALLNRVAPGIAARSRRHRLREQVDGKRSLQQPTMFPRAPGHRTSVLRYRRSA